MKKWFAFLLFTPCFANAQQHSLEKLWETDAVIAVPESVLPVMKDNIMYVSLIDGGGWDVDGKGGVGRIKPDGTGYDSSWITGLNAPKGMGIVGNYLYVADVSEVVVIDIPKGKIEKKIQLEGASGLNDITVDDHGVIYVSDSRTARIWQIKNDQATVYLEDMNGVNGLKAVGDELFIAKGKSFIKADSKRNITSIAEMPQGGDGLEPVGNGDFIFTAWAGYIFYVYKDGTYETLLDTHLDSKNTADIGYDPKQKIVYVPGFNAKTVTAYRLK